MRLDRYGHLMARRLAEEIVRRLSDTAGGAAAASSARLRAIN